MAYQPIDVGAGPSPPNAASLETEYSANVKTNANFTELYTRVGTVEALPQITGINEVIDDRVAALLVAGSNVTLTYNDVANTLTIASTATGGGNFSATITSPATAQTLRYNGSAWVNAQLAAADIANITTFARTFLDDVDAPTVRSTLGLGTVATATQGATNSGDIPNKGQVDTLISTAVSATGARAVTGATTVAAGDVIIIHNSASPANITLPTGLPLGTVVRLIQLGVGIPTFVAGTSATLNGSPTAPVSQNKSAVATVVATDTWLAE